MTVRVSRLLLAAAALSLSTMAGAQSLSDSYRFLKAVRDSDGAKVSEILKEPGVSIINTRDRDTGETALHIAARRSDSLYLRFLLQNGANPNLQDREGNTAMMVVANQNWPEGIEILDAYSADPNLANTRGETPLIRAVQLRNLELARAILAAGGDPDRSDTMAGMSARDYAARDNRSPAIQKLLREAKPVTARSGVAGPQL